MTCGFQISEAILVSAIVIAFALIPRKMRTEQATAKVDVAIPSFGSDSLPEPAAA